MFVNLRLVCIGLLITPWTFALSQEGPRDCGLLFPSEIDSLSSRESSFYWDSVAVSAGDRGDSCVMFCARVQQSVSLDDLGMPDSALTLLYWVNNHFSGSCDSSTLLSMYANLTSSYLSLVELDRVDSIARIVRRKWPLDSGQIRSRLAIMSNQAIGHAMGGELALAMQEFREVLMMAREYERDTYIQRTLGNIGTLKGMQDELDSAAYYINEAAKYGDGDIRSIMDGLINISLIYKEQNQPAKALAALDSAESINSRVMELDVSAYIYRIRSDIYDLMGERDSAYSVLLKYTDLYEAMLNEERLNAAAEMMEKYESEKKVREIQQLKLERTDAELEKQRIRNARNTLFFGVVLVLGAAIALWSRLRLVRRSRDEVKKQRDVADDLLRNILPVSVAEELKQKGRADAQYFESATILFTDFSSFTEISSQMSAQELVSLLNNYFRKFDEIVDQYGLEKIKTIGDSYMATASIPGNNEAGPADVVLAAFEMMEYVNEQLSLEGHHFAMRAGVHSGPVVAGIVGVKKFQYDIWGDSVNIASRMESNSEPGRINISSETYELLHEDDRFVFESRGMIHAKGKGQIEMFFVERSLV